MDLMLSVARAGQEPCANASEDTLAALTGESRVASSENLYQPFIISRSGCRANPCVEGVCGRGAECEDVGGRPVCKCLPGHHVSQ